MALQNSGSFSSLTQGHIHSINISNSRSIILNGRHSQQSLHSESKKPLINHGFSKGLHQQLSGEGFLKQPQPKSIFLKRFSTMRRSTIMPTQMNDRKNAIYQVFKPTRRSNSQRTLNLTNNFLQEFEKLNVSAEQHIKRLQDQLKFRNRFFRMVIHDLRGPTTSIKLGSELALNEIKNIMQKNRR